MRSILVVFVVIGLFPTTLLAGDDNPFKKAKVGDWVEYKMSGGDIAGTTKMTIVTADDKEVAYEIAGTFSFMGKESKAPLQTINPRNGRGAWNAARFDEPAYDVLSKQYIAALDLPSQRRIAGQIETLLLDETPVIYPYFCDFLSATSKNITGVYPTPTGQLFFWNAAKTS